MVLAVRGVLALRDVCTSSIASMLARGAVLR
jgi:hypothetical protein